VVPKVNPPPAAPVIAGVSPPVVAASKPPPVPAGLVPSAPIGDLAVAPPVKPSDKQPDNLTTGTGPDGKTVAAGKLVLPSLPVQLPVADAQVPPQARAHPEAPATQPGGPAGANGAESKPSDAAHSADETAMANRSGRRPGDPNARPSGAPRSDSESPPVSLSDAALTIPMRVGRVVAREGMTIHTVVPRVTVGMSFTIPNNPVARLTFNRRGEVINVKLLRTTGTANWDGPIIAALYGWTASGPKLSEITDKAFMDVRLLLSEDGD
jgi:hypothetical protein